MKPIVPVLGVIAALWLFLGTAWMSNRVCSTTATNSFQIMDGDFKTSSKETFMFLLSSQDISYLEDTQLAFKNVANHLIDNSEKQLRLSGLFDDEEKNNTAYDNLGIARAETIKSIFIKLDVPEDQILTSAQEVDNLYFFPVEEEMRMFGGVNFLFKNKGTSNASPKTEPKSGMGSESPVTKISANDVSTPAFLEITEVSSSFTRKENFKPYFKDLKAYLKANPKKELIVICYNDDSQLAKSITKKVKGFFQRNGLSRTSITRKTAKVSDSPEGKSGVNIIVI